MRMFWMSLQMTVIPSSEVVNFQPSERPQVQLHCVYKLIAARVSHKLQATDYCRF